MYFDTVLGVVSISAWRGGRDRQAQDRIVGVNETFQPPNSGRENAGRVRSAFYDEPLETGFKRSQGDAGRDHAS